MSYITQVKKALEVVSVPIDPQLSSGQDPVRLVKFSWRKGMEPEKCLPHVSWCLCCALVPDDAFVGPKNCCYTTTNGGGCYNCLSQLKRCVRPPTGFTTIDGEVKWTLGSDKGFSVLGQATKEYLATKLSATAERRVYIELPHRRVYIELPHHQDYQYLNFLVSKYRHQFDDTIEAMYAAKDQGLPDIKVEDLFRKAEDIARDMRALVDEARWLLPPTQENAWAARPIKSASNWSEMAFLTVGSSLEHLLRWGHDIEMNKEDTGKYLELRRREDEEIMRIVTENSSNKGEWRPKKWTAEMSAAYYESLSEKEKLEYNREKRINARNKARVENLGDEERRKYLKDEKERHEAKTAQLQAISKSIAGTQTKTPGASKTSNSSKRKATTDDDETVQIRPKKIKTKTKKSRATD